MLFSKTIRKQFGFEGCDKILLDSVLNEFEFLIV
jgi:hypothetical protein